MQTRELYLSLGSNQGDRAANLQQAVRMLDEGFKVPHSALSEFLSFPSWGFDGADFLNCAVRYDLPEAGQDPALHALAILNLAKAIEKALGRSPEPVLPDGARAYQDRPIDIDLLVYGTLKMDTPRLTLPHKLMEVRDFVLTPLRQVASESLLAQFPGLFD